MKKIIVAFSMLIISIVMIAQSEYSPQLTGHSRNYSNNYPDNQVIGLYDNYYGISLNPTFAQRNNVFVNESLIRFGPLSPKEMKRINKNIEKRNKNIAKRNKKVYKQNKKRAKKWEKENKKQRKERDKVIKKQRKQIKKIKKSVKKIGKW